jgi:hypothetical protein
MAELADAIALGAIGETLGGSNPLPPTKALREEITNMPQIDTERLQQFLDENGDKWWWILLVTFLGICLGVCLLKFSMGVFQHS